MKHLLIISVLLLSFNALASVRMPNLRGGFDHETLYSASETKLNKTLTVNVSNNWKLVEKEVVKGKFESDAGAFKHEGRLNCIARYAEDDEALIGTCVFVVSGDCYSMHGAVIIYTKTKYKNGKHTTYRYIKTEYLGFDHSC